MAESRMGDVEACLDRMQKRLDRDTTCYLLPVASYLNSLLLLDHPSSSSSTIRMKPP